LGVLGLVPFVRYAILQLQDNPGSHLQSLLVGVVLLVMSFLSVIIGIVSDLLRTNRSLIEDTLEHTKKMRFGLINPSDVGPVDVAEQAVPAPARRRRAS
ncbi:MAG: glycosyltransferase family 2 protein, partial [Frankiales bacterium]|nr:glycosyltransferase family 2 protein [Frankiales bacterium]